MNKARREKEQIMMNMNIGMVFDFAILALFEVWIEYAEA